MVFDLILTFFHKLLTKWVKSYNVSFNIQTCIVITSDYILTTFNDVFLKMFKNYSFSCTIIPQL